tara:strand:+ start:265 stop:432 length:168 start_codon:yes stop_codon:yes gene_type:complete
MPRKMSKTEQKKRLMECKLKFMRVFNGDLTPDCAVKVVDVVAFNKIWEKCYARVK